MAFKPSFNPENGRVKILVRLSYCKVMQKTASVDGGRLLYRTNGLIMKDTPEGQASIKTVQKAIVHIIKENWPGKDPVKFIKALKDRRGFFDGDQYLNEDGEVREYYEGTRYLKLTTDRKPKLRNRRGDEIEPEEADELFRSGYWAIAYFHFYPIKEQKKGGNGIFSNLDALQFFRRDEEFEGGGIDEDEIDDYGDEEDDDFEDDDERPAKKKSSKKRPVDDDDDEDDDEDDEDERPAKKSKKSSGKRRRDEEDDEDDDEDDEDERPAKKSKKTSSKRRRNDDDDFFDDDIPF